MKNITIVLLTLVVSGCASVRETQVEYVTREQLNAREAEIQCKVLARTVLQMARCELRR